MICYKKGLKKKSKQLENSLFILVNLSSKHLQAWSSGVDQDPMRGTYFWTDDPFVTTDSVEGKADMRMPSLCAGRIVNLSTRFFVQDAWFPGWHLQEELSFRKSSKRLHHGQRSLCWDGKRYQVLDIMMRRGVIHSILIATQFQGLST